MDDDAIDCSYVDTETCWACDGEGCGESGAICRRCKGQGEVRADEADEDDGLDCFDLDSREADDGEGEP